MKKIVIASMALGFCVTSFAVNKTTLPAATNPANMMTEIQQNIPGPQAPQQGNFGVQVHPQVIENTQEVENEVVLKQVQLLGVQHKVPANVTRIYQKMIGQKLHFTEIQNMATAMEAAYRNDGYILVQVILPPQEISLSKGVVQLQIIEGQIAEVTFVGDNPEAAKAQLQRYAEQIELEDPISYQSIDRFLVLANQLPGIDVSATVVPNKNVVGAADLVVTVTHTKASSFFNFNNRGTQYIGPTQASAGASIYNIFGADSLSVAGATVTSRPSELAYENVSYDLITDPYATEINPSFTATQTMPGASLGAFDMYGNSTKYNLSVNQPLFVSTPQKWTLQTDFYHQNSYNNIFSNTQLYDDTITALTLGLNYQGIFLKTYNDISLSSTLGLPILGAPNTLSNPSVVGATTKFVRFNLMSTNIHYLTDRTSVDLGTQFQVSPDDLISGEQIGYGGSFFGQAYTPSIITGDSGLMGTLALRYDLPAPKWMSLMQPEVFFDAGTVASNNVAPGVASGASGESAGIALNMIFVNHFQIGLVLAKPLKLTQTTGVPMGWQSFFDLTGMF